MGASSQEEFQKQSAANMLDLWQLITFSSSPRNLRTNDNANGTRIFAFAAKESCFQLIKNAMTHKVFETEWSRNHSRYTKETKVGAFPQVSAQTMVFLRCTSAVHTSKHHLITRLSQPYDTRVLTPMQN